MVRGLKSYLDKLKANPFYERDKEDKKKFTISFVEVRDQTVHDRHCVPPTFASTYSDTLNPLAHGLGVISPDVVLVMDE
jgi:hypothetical protein